MKTLYVAIALVVAVVVIVWYKKGFSFTGTVVEKKDKNDFPTGTQLASLGMVSDAPQMLNFKPNNNVANAFQFSTINGKCFYRKDDYSDWMHCENINVNNAGVNIAYREPVNQNIITKTSSANLTGIKAYDVVQNLS